jgi:hypothetical protein
VLIVVLGSSGLNEVEGVPTGDPNALLQVVGSRDPRYVIVLCPRNSRAEAREQAHVLIAARAKGLLGTDTVVGARLGHRGR